MQRIPRGTLMAALALSGLACAVAEPARAETLFAVASPFGGGVTLYSFDSATPGTISAALPVTGLAGNERILGIDFRPATGELYALGTQRGLYTLDTRTGAATFAAPFRVPSPGAINAVGLDFNPVEDYLRVVSTPAGFIPPLNLRVDLATGLAALEGTPRFAPGDPNEGRLPFVTGSAYANNFFGAGATTLFGIDTNLGVLFRQEPESGGVLSTVGSLGTGTPLTTFFGFDISGVTGAAYAAVTPPAAPGADIAQLYTVNLQTGAATLVGQIGGGAVPVRSIVGIAAPVGAPIPEPGTLLLLGSGLIGAGAAAVRRRRKAGTSAGA